MADEAQQQIRSINWREVFPFTHLFRAFRIAVHPSKLVLALVALLLIYFGGRLLDVVWADKYLVTDTAENYGFYEPDRSSARDANNPRGIFISLFNYEVRQVNRLAFSGGLDPDAVAAFLFTGPKWLLTNHPLFFVLFMAWFLFVWSVFGGAISRIAAVHVARDEKLSVRQAIRFSSNKLLSFLFAPLIPLLILLIIAAVVAVAGWVLFHIPYVGPIVAGLIFVLALVAGFVMALVLLGLIGGFNLMYPTIAVEGSDSFDAISRSFSYAFARPWRLLWYTVVALVYGALTYIFVRFFIWMVLALTHFAVSWFFRDGGQPAAWFPVMWPGPGEFPGGVAGPLAYHVNHDNLKSADSFAAGLISFWVYLVIGLLGAYAISFYFSANTIIYYLMRREVDATELDDVYAEETDDDFGDAVAAAAAARGPGDGEGTPAAAAPAPAAGTTSAPAGGVTGAAGSADPGGDSGSGSDTGAARAYDAPRADTAMDDRPRAPDDSIPGAPQSPPA